MIWSRGFMFRWWNFRARAHCPHQHIEGIYGDRVNQVGGYQLRCTDCGAYLEGPVSLAKTRGQS